WPSLSCAGTRALPMFDQLAQLLALPAHFDQLALIFRRRFLLKNSKLEKQDVKEVVDLVRKRPGRLTGVRQRCQVLNLLFGGFDCNAHGSSILKKKSCSRWTASGCTAPAQPHFLKTDQLLAADWPHMRRPKPLRSMSSPFSSSPGPPRSRLTRRKPHSVVGSPVWS